MRDQADKRQQIAGWREKVSIPRFQIGPLTAKLDTGARTSALHATDIKCVQHKNRAYVRFRIYDNHKACDSGREVQADCLDTRFVRSSGGQRMKRFVICERIVLGELELPIQITLVDRVRMRYPLLIGREALAAFGLLVDSTSSWHLSSSSAG